jgi:5-(carboxyamino)imidazole ribonucleotide synthase
MIVLPPGSSLGVLGNGQLGRMFALAAERLGYKVIGFGPDADSPLSQVCSTVHCASCDNEAALTAFANQVDAVTVEFENIPSRALELIARHKLVYPSAQVLHICQHRLREKEFLSGNSFPVTPYTVLSVEMQDYAPAVFKTTGFGYDGKGQRIVHTEQQARQAIVELGGAAGDIVAEKLVDLEKEISVIGARTQDEQFAAYGPIENKHVNHILDVSCLPAQISAKLSAQAIEITRAIMECIDVVGLLCVEFFITTSGELLVNELAPRPHNSGHLTIEGCSVSQFEQLVRIMCGLPLGSTQLAGGLGAAAMANLLGDLWTQGELENEPQWSRLLSLPSVHLHLYGKAQAKPGRKMGHITACADTAEEAVSLVTQARSLLI